MEKFNLPIGTVLFSTNLNQKDNATPGIFNHCAMILNDKQDIIESQEGIGVQQITWEEYVSRPYDFKSRWGVLYPRSKSMGIKAAEEAETYIGRKYGALSSIRKHGRKMNCIKVIGSAYSEASNTEVKPAIPDDLIKFVNLFTDKINEVV